MAEFWDTFGFMLMVMACVFVVTSSCAAAIYWDETKEIAKETWDKFIKFMFK